MQGLGGGGTEGRATRRAPDFEGREGYRPKTDEEGVLIESIERGGAQKRVPQKGLVRETYLGPTDTDRQTGR